MLHETSERHSPAESLKDWHSRRDRCTTIKITLLALQRFSCLDLSLSIESQNSWAESFFSAAQVCMQPKGRNEWIQGLGRQEGEESVYEAGILLSWCCHQRLSCEITAGVMVRQGKQSQQDLRDFHSSFPAILAFLLFPGSLQRKP